MYNLSKSCGVLVGFLFAQLDLSFCVHKQYEFLQDVFKQFINIVNDCVGINAVIIKHVLLVKNPNHQPTAQIWSFVVSLLLLYLDYYIHILFCLNCHCGMNGGVAGVRCVCVCESLTLLIWV